MSEQPQGIPYSLEEARGMLASRAHTKGMNPYHHGMMWWLVEEVERLRRGELTPEEVQSLCHNLHERPRCTRAEFEAGCEQFQDRLFGPRPFEGEVMSDEKMAEIEERSTRDLNGAMHAGCTDYFCDCHMEIPGLVAEVRRLRAELARVIPYLAAHGALGYSVGGPITVTQVEPQFDGTYPLPAERKAVVAKTVVPNQGES